MQGVKKEIFFQLPDFSSPFMSLFFSSHPIVVIIEGIVMRLEILAVRVRKPW